MADLTLGSVYLADIHAPFRVSLVAGEALDAGAPCYIDPTLGTVFESISDADGNGASFDGICVLATSIGDPVTLFQLYSRIHIIASGLAIGDFYYPSDTAGYISDAPIIAAEKPILKAVSATDVIVVRMDLPVVVFA